LAQAKDKTLHTVSIRLPVADIERARAIAAKEGIGYQTVLKRAIHEALAKPKPARKEPKAS
jgi:predicted DNA binding CopG/RHH family protein